MISQIENTDHAAEIEDGQKAGIVNHTSTEAKAESENKKGNPRKKVSSSRCY